MYQNRRSKTAPNPSLKRWSPCEDGTEPDLRNVDLADVHPAPRREKPEWNAPVNSPTPWVFVVIVVVIILVVFAVLELAEWAFAQQWTLGWRG